MINSTENKKAEPFYFKRVGSWGDW